MQLEKILQTQGFGSRKECRRLVESGQVLVDGVACGDPSADLAPEGLVLDVGGWHWTYRERLYLAMNKPAGHECSQRPAHHPSVLELLPPAFRAREVQCVGRLDADTTGLLLLSDDGGFLHAMTSPRKCVSKTYEALVADALQPWQLAALLSGVLLKDEPRPIAALACVALGPSCLRVTISEGKYHQVRRMVAATGTRVVALRRVAIGRLQLPPQLEPGAWMELEAPHLELLRG